MTTREGIRTMTRREDESPPPPERRGPLWRLEYTLLVGIALLMTAFAIAFFYFGADTSNLKSWGYAAGYGGRIVFENRPEYERVHRWMERHGTLSMFLLSTFPNPLFDLAGVAAGAVKMPIKRFFPAVLCGKVIKDTYLAAVGGLGATIFAHLL